MSRLLAAVFRSRWLPGPLLIAALLGAAPASPPAAPPVVILRLDGAVQTVTAEYIGRGLDFAAQRHAPAVVLELSTPGGLDTSMRAIIEKIFASPVPVIGYVAPSGARSASAGFYILLSCDLAAMAPGTNTGAAHPVILGGAQPDPVEAAKMQSDAAAFIRTIALQRRRNVDLAQKGVIDSQSFTEREALQGGLIDLIAPSLDQLLAELDGRSIQRLSGATQVLHLNGAPRVEFAMSLREQVLDMDASLAFAMLAIGALLIYVEFTHPGVIVPGVVGVILVALSLFALSLLPISWAGAGLLVLALALFGLEAQFPSHGVLALGGVVSMALGGLLLIDSPIPEMRVGWSIALGVAIGFGCITMLLLELVMRARRARVVTGAQGLLGESGWARTALNPAVGAEGTVWVHGELWRASAPQPIPPGARVRVTAVRGLELEVVSLDTPFPRPPG